MGTNAGKRPDGAGAIAALSARVDDLERQIGELTRRAGRRQRIEISFPLLNGLEEDSSGLDEGAAVAQRVLAGLRSIHAKELEAGVEVFIGSLEMAKRFEEIVGQRLSGNQVVLWYKREAQAGRMLRGMRRGRHPKNRRRGFILCGASMCNAENEHFGHRER